MQTPHQRVSPEKFSQEVKRYTDIFGSTGQIIALLNQDTKPNSTDKKFDLLEIVTSDTDDIENTRYEILETLERFATNVDEYKIKYILQDIHKTYGVVKGQEGYDINLEEASKVTKKWKSGDIVDAIFSHFSIQSNLSFVPKFLAHFIKDENIDDEVRSYLINDHQIPDDNQYYKAAKELLSQVKN